MHYAIPNRSKCIDVMAIRGSYFFGMDCLYCQAADPTGRFLI